MTRPALDYIPGLIAAYRAGHATDHVHLGYWPPDQSLTWPQAQEAMTTLHLDALDLRCGQTLIDIGCGIGGSLRVANERLRNGELIGVNIDERQLAVCHDMQPRNGNSLSWIKADASAVPRPDACADRVLSLEAMFHFSDRFAFLKEAARLLAPRGILVCSDILLGPCATNEQTARRDLVTKGYAPWPHPEATSDEVTNIARNAGLTLLQEYDLTSTIGTTWDYIVSSKASPSNSAEAAMAALHRQGKMSYILFVFQLI